MLHITRSLILEKNPRKEFLNRFDDVHQKIMPDESIPFLNIAENRLFETKDIIWALRATVEDSSKTMAIFAKNCAWRAEVCTTNIVRSDSFSADSAWRAAWWADKAIRSAESAAKAAVWSAWWESVAAEEIFGCPGLVDVKARMRACKRREQREDIIKLLQPPKE